MKDIRLFFMDGYRPGLHIVASFHASRDHLTAAARCKGFFDRLITELSLQKLGEVYHSFDNGGFTAVVCLTESHISIHTWPEYGFATFDVFLSNFNRDNTEKARDFYQRTLSYFEGTAIHMQEISR